MSALRDVQQKPATTVIIVTHDPDVASQLDRLITLVDGAIASDADPALDGAAGGGASAQGQARDWRTPCDTAGRR